jgi:predicted ATP-grasp superfamily ATP-dependent carboligase
VNLFVFEWVSGGGLAGEPLPPALAREGDMMVRALLCDLAELPGVRAATSRDPRLPPIAGMPAIVPEPGEDPLALYARGVAAADAAWPTAPETGGALERLARATLDLGVTLLGCHPDAVRLTTSKRATALALRAAGVPVIPTFGAGDRLPPLPGPWVVKPDDGAGCEDTHVVPDWRAAAERLALDPARSVAQPWIAGCPASLSLVCRDGRAELLCGNRQHVRVVACRPTLAAITVNGVTDPHGRLAELARRIAAAVPGLWGYVGVDLVLTDAGAPVVLEINPRLTTSYCGLRRAAGINAAARVLDAPGGPEAGTATPVLLELEPDDGD